MFSLGRHFLESAILGNPINYVMFLYLYCLLSSCSIAGRSDSVPDFNDGRNGNGPVLLVVGDSLSSGVMASVPMGSMLPTARANKFMEFLLGSDHSLEASQRVFSEYHHSATVTDAKWGIREAIGNAHQTQAKDVPVLRGFKWGARLMNAINYVDEIEKEYPFPRKADYIFVWIGGNDFCRDKTPQEFESQYVELLLKLSDIHPDAMFFVALLPKVHSILKHTFTYSPVLNCTKNRKALCGPIFREGGESTILSYNQSIRKAVTKVEDTQIIKGKIKPVIHLITEIENTSFETEDLCYDCFHPSVKGHLKFAKIFVNRIKEILNPSP